MTSVRAFDRLQCSTCNDVTLHRANVCVGCETPNHSSGLKPVPRAQLTRNTAKPTNYCARAEAASARRRARAARAKVAEGGAP